MIKFYIQKLIHIIVTPFAKRLLKRLPKDRVVIVSYCRSGTVWLRCLLAGYLDDNVELENIQDYIPDLNGTLTKLKKPVAAKIYCAHAHPKYSFPNTIYLHRDREEVLKSYHKHHNRWNNIRWSFDKFEKYFEGNIVSPMAFSEYHKRWMAKDVYKIKYPFGYNSITRLIDYLGLTRSDHKERLEKTMEKFTRKNMAVMQSRIKQEGGWDNYISVSTL